MVKEKNSQRDYRLSIDEAKKMVWYHTIEIDSGFTTKGKYDWRPYWDKFNFGDLHDKTVLDVGAGDGFFSFEFEKRGGGKVTALDIQEEEECDHVKMGTQKEIDKKTYCRAKKCTEFKRKFNIAKNFLDSKVKRVEMNIYDISRASIGSFDIVFCGDVLLHLTDPIRALAKMKGVCKSKIIISTPIYSTKSFSIYHPLQKLAILMLRNLPLSNFMGATGHGAFWIPTRKCLEAMIIASGFKKTKWISGFTPKKEDLGFGGARLERGVIHGFID